jgi:hypothetical protein
MRPGAVSVCIYSISFQGKNIDVTCLDNVDLKNINHIKVKYTLKNIKHIIPTVS